MSEKVLTYKKSENDVDYICDHDVSATSLVYLRCAKLHEKYLKTRNSGVKYFIVAKNVADVGQFGDVVIRLEYFDEGKLKTKLIFVACIKCFTHFSLKGKRHPISEESIQFFFDTSLKIKIKLQPEPFQSAESPSKSQQSETASELRNFLNCRITDCEFVLCNISTTYSSFKKSYETDERFNITNEILGTESVDWVRLKYDAAMKLQYDPNYNQFKMLFCENFRIMDNSWTNDDKTIIKEMKSLFQSSDSSLEMLCEIFKIKIKYHFSSTCEALSEKSDFLQKFMKDFGLKLRSEATIDPTRSTGKPAILHVTKATELHKATEQNHVEKMKELIDRDRTLLNTRDRDGKTPLHVACAIDNTEAAECLLSYFDCLVDIADKYEKYALHYAAENGNVDIIKLLLKPELNMPKLLNKKDVNGETALYLACKYGKTKVVEFILPYAKTCFVDVGDGKEEKCTIHCASKNGYVEIVKLLLKQDPSLLNKRDKDGETSLHLASAVGNLEVVDFLLTLKDLELNVKDKWDNTCLHIAALSKNCKILSALLKKEPNFLKSKNQICRTALHIAASIRNDTVIEFLLNLENCDVNVQDKNGDTPLHLYVNGYKQTYFDIENTDITIFKQKCSSLVNIANKDGDTPLHKAVLVADHESVEKLIYMGSDVNVKNANGQTPEVLAHKLVEEFEKELIQSYLKDASNGDK